MPKRQLSVHSQVESVPYYTRVLKETPETGPPDSI
jgi:hypothetical protein